MSTNDPLPEVSHCPFCGYPWPKIEGKFFKCWGCDRLFRVTSASGTLPRIEPPKVILEPMPGSIPDTKSKKRGIADE